MVVLSYRSTGGILSLLHEVVSQLVDSPDVILVSAMRVSFCVSSFFSLCETRGVRDLHWTVSWVQEVSSESESDADGRVSLGLREMETWRMF